uniref:Probable RNA polymerase II nuclear localization protein SLC7A6OS n=1 Tax=Clastoptera arizonana TaxID=38151 RepID=A0A1B6DHM4_9HEMI
MALVRLKRSFDEEPIDTLVIAYKKRKEDSQETSVFKFATTLNEKEDVFQHYPKVIDLADSKKLFKQKHVSNITDKLRKESRLCSKNNRLKLVNLLRESLERDSGDSQSFSEVTLLDVEKNFTSDDNHKADEKLEDVKDTSYVYDIYYTSKTLNDFDITTTDSEISCHVLDSELILENYRDDAYAAEESQEDDDDSNDENNWRNDYPEEGQDDDSIGEEDMEFVVKYGDLALGKFRINLL